MANENIQIVASPGTQEGLTILRIKGPLNIHTVFDFQSAIRAQTAQAVVVDFSDVPFIDSTGLGALVSAHLTAQKSNRKLALAAMNVQVRALLDMTHVSQFFKIYLTAQEAEAGVS